MLFNSFEFFLFLPIVYILYWFVFNKNIRHQNIFILIASYVFYGWWDWRFLSLIIISSLVDYYIGLNLEKTENKKHRNYLKYLSLFVNLGFLGVFKYFNFFVDSFADLLLIFGFTAHMPTLKILLPVGISFYTFQTIGYTLDVFKRKYTAEKSLLNFMVYVCFFPQLVAGPIERARNLLPQIRTSRVFSLDLASDGLRLILIGLFKKVVIADNLANGVDYVFADYASQSPGLLLWGALFFMIQVYCDFAGYSDIAIGVARLFGFKLMKNFDFPFYTKNAQEFWTRWHISLSNWFRDYLLFGIKSSFKSKYRFALNFLFTLTVIGFWHGANWTFVVFGLINGLYIMPSVIWRNKKNKFAISRDKMLPSLKELLHMVKNFILLIIPPVFFRSEDIRSSLEYFWLMFTNPNKLHLEFPSIITSNIIWFALPLVAEWFMRNKEHSLDIAHLNKPLRWLIYIVIIFLIINYGEFQNKQFIYFQF